MPRPNTAGAVVCSGLGSQVLTACANGLRKPELKLIVIFCLGLITVLAAACSGGEKPRVLTATPAPPAVTAQPTSTPAPIVPVYTVAGSVLDASNSLLLGGLVTLEPLGKSAITDVDGLYVITGVPDGDYVVSVTPKCVAYGCYTSPLLIVAGSDVLEFNVAPFPASLLPGGPPASRYVSEGSIPLDQVEFPGDHLLLISPNDLQPGESAQIVLAGPECIRCAALLAVDARVAWSAAPGEGASIDPESGLLSIDAATAIGSVFTVTADVEEGRYSVSAEVNVYSAQLNPLAGVWREKQTGNINQLLLTAGGEFAVTANPFEHYQDYWGVYTFNLGTGAIELTVAGANQTAPESQGTGTFEIDGNGVLSLGGICLGRWDEATRSLAANCDHEFER